MFGLPIRRANTWPKLITVLVLAMIHACVSDTHPAVKEVTLNVVVLDDIEIDLDRLEYTIACRGNGDTFLDGNDSFPDESVFTGVLEVDSTQTVGNPPMPVDVWQGFAGLPPGPCVIQLRSLDNDGERICVSDHAFIVLAEVTVTVDLVLLCDISFQAASGTVDLLASFSFVIGNHCPDIFIFNTLSSMPMGGTAEVQVRGQDVDSACGVTCDPQTCDLTTLPPTCSPGPDNGMSINVTSDIGSFDCDQDGMPDGTSCVLFGDQFNTGNMDYICPAGPSPGTTATLMATISDGDLDCDKTKEISIVCRAATASCGDGFVDAGEICDGTGSSTGGETATCDADCTAATCGDGTVNHAAGELCDDSNTTSGDGCNASCTVEFGYTCTGSPSNCNVICGDSIIAGSETCDDGNTINGDGCSTACTIENNTTNNTAVQLQPYLWRRHHHRRRSVRRQQHNQRRWMQLDLLG